MNAKWKGRMQRRRKKANNHCRNNNEGKMKIGRKKRI
jgi:hypothetical protein